MTELIRLESFLAEHAAVHPLSEPVAQTILEIAEAALRLHAVATDGPGGDAEPVEVGVNPDGDRQVPLDLIADRLFLEAARRAPLAAYASEELAEPVVLDPSQPIALAIDPLDGSSNVALNLSYGVIFSILPTVRGDPTHLETFLQPGRMQLAAGLIILGPRLALVLTVGAGTHVFMFSKASAGFVLTERDIRIPAAAREFAINASNYRYWDSAIRLYFDDCLKGVHGPREQNFNMRWLASVVVEAYRILVRGGVFLYPADRREGYGEGRLRLVYEANPIALLIEEADGAATDGIDPILTLRPRRLHQRTPLIFGSRREVTKLTQYRKIPPSVGERSPLFGTRGLFRV